VGCGTCLLILFGPVAVCGVVVVSKNEYDPTLSPIAYWCIGIAVLFVLVGLMIRKK
jgi:glycerol uptake facilitator-like aquaporin